MQTLTPTDLKDLSKAELLNLVERGILRVMSDKDASTLANIPKEELPEYQQFAHLRGVGISISAAARKYQVPQQTISRWLQRGIIARIGMEKNRVLIDEADVAYCAEIRRNRPGAGRWLFHDNGTPYTPRT
jgi:hypothetical protein